MKVCSRSLSKGQGRNCTILGGVKQSLVCSVLMGSFKIRDPKFSHGHSKFKYHVSSKFFFSIQEYIPRNKTQKNQSLKYAGF